MPEAFTFLADAELRPNYQTSAAAWEFAHQMQESLHHPGIPFLGLTVSFGAESYAVVRFSVSGAVWFARYSAGF